METAHIDFDALRCFVAVGETLSFVQASERLGASPSAVTRRIQRLEDALQLRLLVRNTRGVALTAAGHRFLPHARDVLDCLKAAIYDVRESERDRGAHLILATLPTVTVHLLPRIIRQFRQRWPDVHLRVIEGSALDVMNRVRDGTADFGFAFQLPRASSDTGDAHDLSFQRILDDPYCLIVPVGHPLESCESVRWSELKPYAAIVAGSTSGNMKLLREALKDVDWLSDTVYEIDHLRTSLGMVEAGLGISVVPLSAVTKGTNREVVRRPLIDPPVHRVLGLFRRRGESLSDAGQQFLALARSSRASL